MSTQSAVRSERPLLTIAIPTYNRAPLLDRLLSTLFDQIQSDSRVELIVSDNASPDDTAAVIQRFRAIGRPFRYLRNAENIGPDRNILQCFEQATGRYVWIFGDDDMLEPDGLATVLTHLSADEYDLVYVSARGYKGPYVPKSHSVSREVQIFHRQEEFARRLHVMFTFISANIVNKDRVSELRSEPFGALSGTSLGHLAWLYTALDSLRKGLIIKDELVAALMDNSGGYSVFEVFGPNYKSILDSRIKSRDVRQAIIAGTLQGYLPGLILDSKHNEDSFFRAETGRALRIAFGTDPRYWLFDVPVTILPPPLDRVWVFLGRVATKIEFVIRWQIMRRLWASKTTT